ncbi:MAG TPA: carbon-nitrogen family hydrolase [Opitutae bacterium]|nr:carbon-nitrogen family hydrolase [Opitutae bacterium]
MKVALAQIEVARGEIARNLHKVCHFIKEAAEQHAGLVCFPEMCTTGFDWELNQGLLENAASTIQALQAAAQYHQIAVCGSFLEQTKKGAAANTLYWIQTDGSIAAKYRKTHLFSLFHEEQHVEAGNKIIVADTSLGKVGCSICYDLRFPELFRACAQAGAEVQVLPAAFPHPRLVHWLTLVRARAIENQCFFIAVNQCGTERHGSDVGDTTYFGHSMIVDPLGEVLVEADESEGLFYAEVDLKAVGLAREQLAALKDCRKDIY